jgi:hypothetical protein
MAEAEAEAEPKKDKKAKRAKKATAATRVPSTRNTGRH